MCAASQACSAMVAVRQETMAGGTIGKASLDSLEAQQGRQGRGVRVPGATQESA